MLKAMGGSGTINPYTGLQENFDLLKAFRDVVMGGADIVRDVVDPVIDTVVEPIFDAAGNLVEPVMKGATNILKPIAGGVTDIFGNLIEGTLDLAKGVGELGISAIKGFDDLLFGGDDIMAREENIQERIERDPVEKIESGNVQQSGIRQGQNQLSQIQKSKKNKLTEGDWVGDKPSPFTTPNVEEELDYANKGMKYKYDDGGEVDVIAEFTGNELIVNDQDKLEKALANKNYAKVASSIRKAMKGGKITPGSETHGGNPMPVDSKGNIYAGGGALPFKVNKGAGIYDHATDQFKPTMTDKEIAMVAQDNINKWELNGMA